METFSLNIVSDRIFTQHPCGLDRSVELDFVPRGLTEPVVLNFAGFTPSYVMQATVLTPQMEMARITLYSPPDCLSPVAFDQVGRRLPLANLCLSLVSEPEYVDPNGGPVPAAEDPVGEETDPEMSDGTLGSIGRNPIATEERGGGCALSPQPTSAVWYLVSRLGSLFWLDAVFVMYLATVETDVRTNSSATAIAAKPPSRS